MSDKVFHRVREAVKIDGVSDECASDVKQFKELLDELSETTSKETHYHNLDKWSDQAYGHVHDMLKKYGFKNGDVEANKKNPDASFWWSIYGIVSFCIYSPNLETQVANHHSSAWERNEALRKDIQDLLNLLEK